MADRELPRLENKRQVDSSNIEFWHINKRRNKGQLAGKYSTRDEDSTFIPPFAPEPSQPKLWPRQYKWKATGNEAIEGPEQVPKGWNLNEPDLDSDDIVGQIKRRHKRIADNIMPKFFRTSLEDMEIDRG